MRERVYAGWVGKSIGGSLGMPYEGVAGPIELDLEQSGLEPVANDDLELQLLWLHALEEDGFADIAGSLERAWLAHQEFHVDEYAIALQNLRRGISAPLSGYHGNWFERGMGAAIRSEIWACLSPGDPQTAARLAHLDACVDHCGEGIEAEKLLAAMQSLVLVGTPLRDAIAESSAVLRVESRFRPLIEQLVGLPPDRLDDLQAFAELMAPVNHHNFTDCLMNVGYTLWALLAGRGDFDQTMRRVIRCGQDTDCTAATAGATLGMMGGLAAIPEKHRRRATDAVVVSPHLAGLGLPATLEELSDRVLSLAAGFDSSSAAVYLAEPAGVSESPIDDGAAVRAEPLASTSQAAVHAMARRAWARDDDGGVLRAAELGRGVALGPALAGRPVADLMVTTEIMVDQSVDGWLMLAAGAGLTAWLDDSLLMDYHGRRPVLPAVHRTEGGAAVPISWRTGEPRRLTLRLLGVRPETRLFILAARADRSLLLPRLAGKR